MWAGWPEVQCDTDIRGADPTLTQWLVSSLQLSCPSLKSPRTPLPTTGQITLTQSTGSHSDCYWKKTKIFSRRSDKNKFNLRLNVNKTCNSIPPTTASEIDLILSSDLNIYTKVFLMVSVGWSICAHFFLYFWAKIWQNYLVVCKK